MSPNPYAHALDGLDLDDPVGAFFAFCREREAIRLRRERGEPPPWTEDPILERGRFLNVFREDDRTTRAILRFLEPLAQDEARLLQGALFARWCNLDTALEALDPELLDHPEALRRRLATLRPWCNATAYPVGPVRVEGRRVGRLRAATSLFHELRQPLLERVRAAEGDTVRATHSLNEVLGLDNDFPIFMAVSDLAWFRPDLVDPASPVPTGIGAVAFLDRLQEQLGLDSHRTTCRRIMELQPELWPEARRPLQPIDVEYLSCECRKYYSYVNDTKHFVGKNCFVPGLTPRPVLDLDVNVAPAQTRLIVLAGGPCSGKTTLGEALRGLGLTVVPETSRVLLEGPGGPELREDALAWQERLMRADVEQLLALAPSGPVVLDTSVVEDVVFAERAGWTIGPRLRALLEGLRFARVFFLEPLPRYEQGLRAESSEEARAISEELLAAYRALAYEPVIVPSGPVAERCALILRDQRL